MIHFEIPKNQSSIIKVIGVGGGGGNAVNYMYGLNITDVDFIVCNTDSQALAQSPVPNKIQLGPNLTQGLGAGANPEIGKEAGKESIDEIAKILKVNTRMAFITAGMGGGTGTGAAPIIAQVCKELGILTVGIVTTPFTYEGRKRLKQAENGIKEMRNHVDTILIISNDKLRQQYGNLAFTQAFSKADNILATAAKCITDLITVDGKVNLDFNDVQTVMKSGGVAILGSAQVAGENRALTAVEEALNSPLLNDSEIKGAKWILLNITSAPGDFEHTLDELEVIQGYVQDQAGETCDIILGMGHNPKLEDKIAVTIIATGFHHKEIDTEILKPKVETVPKVILELGQQNTNQLIENKKENATPEIKEEEVQAIDPYAPQLVQPTTLQAQDVQHEYTPTEKIATNKEYLHLEIINTNEEQEQSKIVENEPTKKNVAEELMLNKNKNEENTNLKSAKEQQPIKIGSRYLTDEEIEERKRFEEQKRALEERVNRLKSLSFNAHADAKEVENVPAYLRKNINLEGENRSSADVLLSGYTVSAQEEAEGKEQINISTINTFLEGEKPD